MKPTIVTGIAVFTASLFNQSSAFAAPNTTIIIERLDAVYSEARTVKSVWTGYAIFEKGKVINLRYLTSQAGDKMREVTSVSSRYHPAYVKRQVPEYFITSDGYNRTVYSPVTHKYYVSHISPANSKNGYLPPYMSSISLHKPGVKGVTYHYQGTGTVGIAPVYIVSMKDSRQEYDKYLLYINKHTYHLEKMTVLQTKGPGMNAQYILTSTSQVFNQPIPAKVFHFIPPAGATKFNPYAAIRQPMKKDK